MHWGSEIKLIFKLKKMYYYIQAFVLNYHVQIEGIFFTVIIKVLELFLLITAVRGLQDYLFFTSDSNTSQASVDYVMCYLSAGKYLL